VSFFEIIKSIPKGVELNFNKIPLCPLSDEVIEKLGVNVEEYNKLNPIFISFKNLSSVVFDDVRIKISFNLSYKPLVYNNKSKVPENWIYNKDKNEFFLNNLDPSEQVNIILYADENIKKDKTLKPEIIIKGEKINFLNEIVGFFKIFNIYTVTIMFSLVVSVIAVLTMVYAFYPKFFPLKTERVLIKEAADRLSTCTMRAMPVNTEIDKTLNENVIPLNVVFFINKVSNMDELLKKDEIVLCVD
jgi:hypothetical protein